MPAETDEGASNPQVGNGGANADNPQVGTPDSGTSPEPQLTHEQAMEALRKARLENADLRTKTKKLSEFEKAAAEAEKAKLSDVERVNAERDAKAQEAEHYRSLYASELTKGVAQSLGFHNPELAYTLVAQQLEYGDDGKPTNAKDLLDALAKKEPYMVADGKQATPARPTPTISATNPGRAAGAPVGPQSAIDFPRLGQGGLFGNNKQ